MYTIIFMNWTTTLRLPPLCGSNDFSSKSIIDGPNAVMCSTHLMNLSVFALSSNRRPNAVKFEKLSGIMSIVVSPLDAPFALAAAALDVSNWKSRPATVGRKKLACFGVWMGTFGRFRAFTTSSDSRFCHLDATSVDIVIKFWAIWCGDLYVSSSSFTVKSFSSSFGASISDVVGKSIAGGSESGSSGRNGTCVNSDLFAHVKMPKLLTWAVAKKSPVGDIVIDMHGVTKRKWSII